MFQSQDAIATPVVPAPLKMGKFKASRLIVAQSWAVLKQDKEMVWFPILSLMTSLIAFVIIAVIYYLVVLHSNLGFTNQIGSRSMQPVDYAFIFVYYLVSFFILNFFQAGILIIAQARFAGQNLSFEDGIRGAERHAGKILVWSLIAATVGTILDFIANKFKLAGRIVRAILGAAWNIMTFFSLPALVIGQTTVMGSFKESARIIRKTWGETIIISLGVGLFFFALVLVVMILSGILIAVAPIMPVVIAVGLFFLIFIIIIAVISSTLGVIFKLALYEYARTGVVPPAFSSELIQNAVKKK